VSGTTSTPLQLRRCDAARTRLLFMPDAEIRQGDPHATSDIVLQLDDKIRGPFSSVLSVRALPRNAMVEGS
jgi:hypothetical protein